MAEAIRLVVGTVSFRPYVVCFLVFYLYAATRDLGWRRAGVLTLYGWAIAFLAEYASTHIGVPFGLYHYTGNTIGQELYVANVPFFDSLSFTFLAYTSFSLARWTLGRGQGVGVTLLAGVLMMLLDVVIDPLAVRGDRWFLGRIFYYPEGGVYFGVPLSNFLGWAVVGSVIIAGYLAVAGGEVQDRPTLGVALYYAILAFNLVMTWWIGEALLLLCGILLHVGTFLLLWFARGIGQSHRSFASV
ncbi:MAG TPA: carotenoid biosynthesis protein [Methylomirabilota bacterium]|nr:carotenoid biosynthesis protein [Methylomirabilota bacterium]